MKDDGLITAAWAEAVRAGMPAVLATVVKVSGSAYRSPGARMLITENGGRTGSISGGCLEGDVLKKAWWLTGERGAAIRVYDNSSEEEAIWEFGLGCNGIVHVLLERWEAGSEPLALDLLRASRADRRGGVLAVAISGDRVGQKLAVFPDGAVRAQMDRELAAEVGPAAEEAFAEQESSVRFCDGTEVFLEYVAPPVRLLLAGAGHDALPVVRYAKDLGWEVTVADGRRDLARAERFPGADRVVTADMADPLKDLGADGETVAILMSHSYPQDSAFFKALDGAGVRYLGVLGPRRRTERMMAENGIEENARLHSPVGLDIGADTPEEIALAMVSEIQAALRGRGGGMLKQRKGPIHQER